MRKVVSDAAKYLARKRRSRIWMRVMICLACIVVFVTTYALILPAVTLEKPTCGLTEHIHAKECYEETVPETQKELVCSKQTLGIHTHTAGCYGEDGSLVCGYADYAVHMHDANCYDQEGTLVCTLPEVKEHSHAEGCYNSDGKLICNKAQGEAHIHAAACYADGAWNCGKLEMQAHQHTDSCFKITEKAPEEKKLICGMEEHTHTEECYPEKAARETTGINETETVHANSVKTEQPESVKISQADETEPESEASGEIVKAGGKKARATEGDADETNAPDGSGALDCAEYIPENGMKIYYKGGTVTEWTLINADTSGIPADAELKLEISFNTVPTADLKAAGGQLTYALPDVLRGVNTQGSIQGANNTTIGTMTVQNNTVTLVLNDEWLVQQGEYVQGTFYVEGRFNLTEIKDQGGSGSVLIGGVNVNVDMEGDWMARYSSLGVEKGFVNAVGKGYPVIERTEEGEFLTYVLTATAGPDGIEDATVVDKFASTAYVTEYYGITTAPQTAEALDFVTENITSTASDPAAGTVYYGTTSANQPIPAANSTSAKPGNLVWHIGKMEPNETRTLTYKVKLVDGYSQHRQTATITNTASAYSDTYLRDTATARFTPKVGFDMKKAHERYGSLEFQPDEDGVGGTITYIIWITAKADNNYAVDTKIYDFFANTSNVIVNPEYVELVEDSFQLYEGKAESQAAAERLTPIEGRLEKDARYNGSYVYHVGMMAPGSSRTLVYKVRIKDSVFLESGGAFQLRNRARIFADQDNTGVGNNGSALQSWSDDMTVSRFKWSEKMLGARVETNTTVTVDGNDGVYAYGDGGSVEEVSAPESFVVPANSIQYVVKVNEAGTLTVNSATMKDELGEYLVYSGYLKVEAFRKTGTGIYTPVDYEAQSPVKTVWLDIDNRSSFEFSPTELGFSEQDAYAYRLIYYAKPHNLSSVAIVGNSFAMSGVVGSGYTLGGIYNSVTTTVTGRNSFSAQKYGWYYEPAASGVTGTWGKGALYWYIKASGNAVPAGTVLQDKAKDNNAFREAACLVGVYRGTLPEDAADISVLQQLTPLPEDAYNCTFTASQSGQHNGMLEIAFPNEILLDEQAGEAVYVVVKTSVNVLPGKISAYEYKNQLWLGTGDGQFAEQNTAYQTILGTEGVSKSAKAAFTYDGATWKRIWGDTHTTANLDLSLMTKPGIYLDWLIDVNYFGTLAGEMELEDILPEGLELSYLRIYAWGDGVTINNISTPEIEGADESQKRTWPGRSTAPACTGYYDAATGHVRWKVNGLEMQNPVNTYPADKPYNHKTIEFQVVCRVTDPDVLLGDEQRNFNNTIIGTKDGQEIGRDSDGITIRRSPASLDKQGKLEEASKTGRIPFSIKVNPLGEDLVPGSDKVILVDELSESLSVDFTTLQVRRGVADNPENPEFLSPDEYTPKIDGNVFSIELPDNTALTVIYDVIVEAAPGQTVSVSNSAHWEGYDSNTNSEVEQPSFSYTVAAQMGSQAAKFSLRKVDAANLNHPLEGAEFKIEQYGVLRDGGSPMLGDAVAGTEQTGITNAAGTLIFGTASGELDIEYDVVYGVTETKAPQGYVKEEETHYFVIAKEVDSATNQYLTYPAGVHVQYAGVSSRYNYVAQNSRGKIPVVKAFQNAEGGEVAVIPGTYSFGIYETPAIGMPEGSPLQELTVTYKTDGTVSCLLDGIPVTAMAFKDLDLDKTYSVYELDASGNPVDGDGKIWVDSKLFEVSYGNNTGITFDQTTGEPGAPAAVTNKMQETYELPESGGPGTWMYIFSGIVMMTGALLYYILRKRRGAV